MGLKQAIDITADQRETLVSLLDRHLPNTQAWVYGSRVNGTSRPGSDLDMVVFSPPEQGPEVSELREAFEESNLPFRVDLFVWDEVPEIFQEEIERGHMVLATPSTQVASWPKVRLGDCIVVNEATYSPKEAWPLVNYLDTGSITKNRIDAIQRLRLSEDKLPSRARRKVEPGDIVFSTVRPSQKHFGLLREIPTNFLASTGFAVFRAQNGIADTGFVYWFLAQDRIVDQLQTIAEHSTSAYPSIKPSDIENLKIALPPLPEQHAIADILGALDHKIDLNRRMNETLEAMARAIFKDWFVDFGPTRAKAEGRASYLPIEIWKMFPDSLGDDDKPAGWEQGTLADVADSPRRAVSPANVPSNTPYIGLEHMPRRSIALTEWGDAGKVGSNKTRFSKGEVLFGKLRPYFHKVGVAPTDGICSTDIVVVAPRAQNWEAFTLACLSSDEFVDYTNQASTGTRMPRTNWKTMAQYEICLPSVKVVSAFQGIVQPLLDRVDANVRENSTLTKTRDILLPKLMSGEIRLPDAEKAVEAVA